MSWKLEIDRAHNGYVVSYETESEDNSGPFIATEVIQDDEKDELRSHEELLWFITEFFGFIGSKHDDERLRVVREKRVD